jgi:hypothetical protein
MSVPGPEVDAEYIRLRSVARALNNRLVKTLSRAVMGEGGKKLGILKGNTLVLDSEDEIAVLMDFCIYNVRRDGRNAVERFLATSPPPPESDEMLILRAMQNAWYSLFRVGSSAPGTGIATFDLLRELPQFFVDVSMSQTLSVGAVFASRAVPFARFTMTGGAALPVPDDEALAFVRKHAVGVVKRLNITSMSSLTPEQDTELTATLIRACLEQGAAEMISYAEPTAHLHPRPTPPGSSRATPVKHVGRNDPCPCGSGKKFKKCCGAYH